MPRKVIAVVFGSDKDLDHVNRVTTALKTRGWAYLIWHDYAEPQRLQHPTNYKRIFTVDPGSVHRDLDGTKANALALASRARGFGDKLAYLTCIGINDDASGVISSYTNTRVVAVPPDVKVYERYPKGVRVYPFSSEAEREEDIRKALDWVEQEFENPDWDADDQGALRDQTEARNRLLASRAKIRGGEIQF